MKHNLILNTDSYKASHWLQYPPGTEKIFSYIESRGGRYDQTLFFGIQAFIKEYLMTPITAEDIDEATEFFKAHGEPFNREGWFSLLDKHNGFLPIRISAVPEGTVVPTGNVLVTVENTDPEFFWVTSYIETALLRAVWYPTTVATQSWHIKQIIKKYLEDTGDVSALNFKLVDFGARGVGSFESAGIGGMGHLVNFMVSDTISGVLAARRFYNEPMAGFSIPAAEHSSITSWGKEREVDAYRNMLTQFGGKDKLVAVVSDSYDLFNAIKLWGTELKQEIIDSGTVLIVRPDSGDPVENSVKAVMELDRYFGSTTNAKGFRVLNHVRVIQGDGINEVSIRGILLNLKLRGYSADNMTFGMGGALLQQVDRDTQKFAMKASAALISGEWVDVFKDPITDSGKRSKKGQVMLWESGGEFITSVEQPTKWVDKGVWWERTLRPIFENGKLLVNETFSTIRARTYV